MPDFSDNPLRAVFSSHSPIEAHLVRGMLEDSGIACVLSGEFFAAADRPVSDATGGVQVFVQALDESAARELLREVSDADIEAEMDALEAEGKR